MLSLDDLAPDTIFWKARDGHCYVPSIPAEADVWIGPNGEFGYESCMGRPGFRPMTRVDVGERDPLGHEDAVARLDDGPRVHAVTNTSPGVFLSTTWSRADVIAFLREHGAEVAGPRATAYGFGVASTDGSRWVFFSTKPTEDIADA